MRYTVCHHTAYPLFDEKKPEIYNAGVPLEVEARSAHEAARIALTRQLEKWREQGSVGAIGTFRHAVICWEGAYGPSVEIVEVKIEAAEVRVADIETVSVSA